ncbi:UDP-glucosyltransferase 2 isoform X2 [Leptinotarsa decemlineata]
MNYWDQLVFMSTLGKTYTENVLKHKNVQNLLNSGEKFDLVIMEHFWNEAMTIFAHHFNCPLVYFSTGPTSIFNSHLLANPSFSSYVPNFLTTHGSRMTFLERLTNLFLDILCDIYMEFRSIPEQNAVLKAAFPNAPDLKTMMYNASLMFVVSHISIHDPLPLQPSIKYIGGHHVGSLKPLPTKIKQFMENASEGVIVFSMGSILKSSNLYFQHKEVILKVFSKMKQKILWKYEHDLDGLPSNVMISDWLPQQEVLAHPNTVAFISHGGLLGMIESVFFGVPILGIPTYWDQYKNIEDVVRRGMALKLNLHDLTEETFSNALNDILNDPKYRKNAKLRSKIMQDQPMKPIDEAVFWVEYVIRHEGAPHLKSAALHLSWYQKYLIDVILFLSFFGMFVLFFILSIIKCVFFNRKVYINPYEKNK